MRLQLARFLLETNVPKAHSGAMRSRDYVSARAASRPRKERLVVALLVATAVGLLALSHVNHGVIQTIRAQLLSAAAPLVSAVLEPVSSLRGMASDTRAFFHTIDENRKLKAENERLRHWQSVAIELKAENDSLRTLANYQPVADVSYVTARVLSTSLGDFNQTILLNAGARQGVENLQPVVDNDGLIGRVIEVGPNSARVLLVSDVASRVPVVSVKGRQRALLTGTGNDMLRLNFLTSDIPIKLGEQIVTTEESGLIPGGIPVGTVFRHDESGYLIKPLRPLTRAEYVRVVQFKGTP